MPCMRIKLQKHLKTTAKHGVYQEIKNRGTPDQRLGTQKPLPRLNKQLHHSQKMKPNGHPTWQTTAELIQFDLQRAESRTIRMILFLPPQSRFCKSPSSTLPQRCSLAQVTFVIKLCRNPISKTEKQSQLQHVVYERIEFYQWSLGVIDFLCPSTINNNQQQSGTCWLSW